MLICIYFNVGINFNWFLSLGLNILTNGPSPFPDSENALKTIYNVKVESLLPMSEKARKDIHNRFCLWFNFRQ
jgi:hypothetical protein